MASPLLSRVMGGAPPPKEAVAKELVKELVNIHVLETVTNGGPDISRSHPDEGPRNKTRT